MAEKDCTEVGLAEKSKPAAGEKMKKLTNRKFERSTKIMKITKEFEKEIAPFFWVEHEESASVCLNVGEYLQEIFNTREDEGFEGNGYDWGSLAQVFLDEQCSNLQGKIEIGRASCRERV